MRSQRCLLALPPGDGVLNAILYAGLPPLWDGFDEPFHYTYVSRIRRERQRQNYGAAEVADSLPTSASTPSILAAPNSPPV